MKKLFFCVTALAITGLAYGASFEAHYPPNGPYHFDKYADDDFTVVNNYKDLTLEDVGNHSLGGEKIPSGPRTSVKVSPESLSKFWVDSSGDLYIRVMDSDKESRVKESTVYQVKAPQDGWILTNKEGNIIGRILVTRTNTGPAVWMNRFGITERLEVTKTGWSISY
jgi:hypothetical protein